MLLTYWTSKHITGYELTEITGTREALEFSRSEETLTDILVSY